MRQLDVIVNDDVLHRVTQELGLAWPVRIRIRFSAAPPPERTGYILRARANLTPGIHQISVETNVKIYRSAKLGEIQKECRLTLLHELKHAEQHEYWSPREWFLDDLRPYALRRSEVEAEAWAKEHYARYKDILRIKPKHVGRKLPG